MAERGERDPRSDARAWVDLWRDLGVEEIGMSRKGKAVREKGAAEPPGEARPERSAAATETSAAIDEAVAIEGSAAALDALRQNVIGDCRRCPLSEARTNVVFGVGTPEARLMFVGEGPGADEDLKGEPFVGRAGQLLDKIISAMGLSRPEIYIANVVKCRPPENRTPRPDEAAECLPFLRAQIRIIRPEVIVTLGKTALEGLLGESIASITKIRGQWFEAEGVPVKATFHPAYLLRSPSAKRPVWEDMRDVMDRLGLPHVSGE